MRQNINLETIFGVPSELYCVICDEESKTRFNDYDIDCGKPNKGDWEDGKSQVISWK